MMATNNVIGSKIGASIWPLFTMFCNFVPILILIARSDP